jgi:TonB family protein
MKNDKSEGKKKKKHFVKLPVYAGGSADFKRFIYDNLVYPEEALEKGIEGSVYLSFTVDDTGKVIDARVTKGLGYGCDEEALRLVRMLRYEKVKNRGVIVKSNMRIRIDFKLRRTNTAGLQITYNTTPQAKKTVPGKKQEEKPVKYNYTIAIRPPQAKNPSS